MAITGTLPVKPWQEKRPPGAASARRDAKGVSVAEPREGKIVFYLLALFTLFLLGRPEDFVMYQPVRILPYAMIIGAPAIALFSFCVVIGSIRLRYPTELKLMFALTLWLMAGIPFSYWRSNSMQLFTDQWLKVVIVFFMLCQTMLSLRRVRHLLWAIFLSGLMATGFSLALGGAVLQATAQANDRFMGLTVGFFAGNYLGIAAAVIIPLMAAMMIHTRSIIKLLILVTSFAVMITVVVLTASRGNLISVTVSLVLVWVFILRKSLKARLIGVVFVVGLVGAVAYAPNVFWERVGSMWSGADSVAGASASESTSQRRELFYTSLAYTFRNPIFGLGMGNFPIAHGTEAHNSQAWKGTHNTFTELSSEGGIPALVFLVSLLWVVISRMRQVVRADVAGQDMEQLRSLALATIVSVVSFAVGGFFAHLAYAYYVYYLAAIGVGIQNSVRHLTPSVPAAEGRAANGNRERRYGKLQEARP